MILELGTGEALVSFLNEDGQPEIVERAKILPAQCKMGAAEDASVKAAIDAQADLTRKYGEAVDRESAFEKLAEERAALEKEKAELEKQKAKEAEKAAEREARARAKQQEQMMKGIGKIANTVLGTFGREATRQITRNLFGGRRR